MNLHVPFFVDDFNLEEVPADHRISRSFSYSHVILDATDALDLRCKKYYFLRRITLCGSTYISLQVGRVSSKVVGTELDAIQLSIFSHRFMSTAEQMGR